MTQRLAGRAVDGVEDLVDLLPLVGVVVDELHDGNRPLVVFVNGLASPEHRRLVTH